jgi:hypothetical protein
MGSHVGVNKILNKVLQRYYCEAIRDLSNSTVQRRGTPYKRTVIAVAGSFARANQENRYLLIAMGYFTKCPGPYSIPKQEGWTAADTREWAGLDLQSGLIQGGLQRMRVSKTSRTA